MRSADVYPSKYLKAEEIDGDLTVTIKSVALEQLENKEGKKQDKPIVYFREVDKGMVVNKTNWTLIAEQHGDESDDWIGQQITLHAMDVEAFGEMVLSIRVKRPRKASTAKLTAPVAANPAAAADDTAITTYWLQARNTGLDRKAALAILNKYQNDFSAALTAIKSGEDGTDLPF
jgi:hypothetical protein